MRCKLVSEIPVKNTSPFWILAKIPVRLYWVFTTVVLLSNYSCTTQVLLSDYNCTKKAPSAGTRVVSVQSVSNPS